MTETPADVYEAAARAFDGEGRRTVTHTHAGLRAAVDVAFARGRAAATPDSATHAHAFEICRFPAIGTASYCADCGEVRWSPANPEANQ